MLGVAVTLMLLAAGCDLDVTNPTAIEDDELNNAGGAALLRGDALGKFYLAFGAQARKTGEFTDEFMVISHSSGTSFAEFSHAFDRRELTPGSVGDLYVQWPQVRRAATVALAKLVNYGPRAHAGEMLAVRGHATLRLAGDFCPGFPITELIDFNVVAGPPLTTQQAFERALADFDTAATFAADSARVLHLARVGRAAALLDLGRFTEAAAAAADVPTSYTWHARYNAAGFSSAWNPLLLWRSSSIDPYTTIADREGANGLDFVGADDPRVQPRPNNGESFDTGTTDTGTPVYNPAKYADVGAGAPIVVAGGIEARLIEAEAALATGGGTWLTILNELRATQVSPALPALNDPVTAEARLDLLFRERAFWLYATGHRLADMRRLIRLYGRTPESVFPTGSYHQHDFAYGTATSLPFDPSTEVQFNPAVTGCTGP